MEIVREAAEGVSTSELAARFGVTPRAIQYTIKSDEERQQDAAVPVAAVSVKVTVAELAAFDAVLASAGIETRSEGLRRLMQAAGGVFVPDAQLAVEMTRYRASLHEVGNGIAQIAKRMAEAIRLLVAAKRFAESISAAHPGRKSRHHDVPGNRADDEWCGNDETLGHEDHHEERDKATSPSGREKR